MSLQVWLPLTKDLRQQGLLDATVINNGATFNSTGKLGGCYSFNGSSNYLTIPQGYIGTDWSYSVWVYSTSTSATQTLGCCRTAVGSGFSIFLIGGKLRIDPGGNNVQWTTSYTYPANTWFHLIVTCNGGTIKYYIDGEYKQNYSATVSSTYWGNIFSVGASQANGSGYGNFLNGRLNDVRIYDHCLSSMEVKELAKGLVLHYPLNQSTSILTNSNDTIEYDCSGYCNNGKRIGTFTWNNDTPKYAVSTVFTGSQRIEAPWGPNEATSFTVAGWFYNSNGTTYYGAKNTYNTYICLEQSRYFIYNSSASAYVGNYTSTRNTWQYIVLVHDAIANKLKLYINGSFISEVTTDGTIYNSDILDIGGRQGTAQYSGKMSDFRIYATALSAEDIEALYKNTAYIDGSGNFYGPVFSEVD